MKTLALTFLALLTFSMNAFALESQASVEALEDDKVSVSLIEDMKQLPNVGSLSGSVTSIYAGSAYALERYYLNIRNLSGACEADDCVPNRTFEIQGGFRGAVQAVYTRQIDKDTYSIALVTEQLHYSEKSDTPKAERVKVLIRVKLTKNDVSEVATLKVVKL